MTKLQPNSVPLFSVKKQHAWRDQLVRFIGLGLIGIVLLGTAFWLLLAANFSAEKFLGGVVQKLKPEVKQEPREKPKTKIEELKQLLEEDNLVEISSQANTPEGDILITTKGGQVLIFAVSKSLMDQVRTLQTLLTKAKIDNKALKKVDFRFEKTVVEY